MELNSEFYTSWLLFGKLFHRWTGAHEVDVTVGVIDSGYCRPGLEVFQEWQWVSCLLPRLPQVLRLGWLDHERSRDRERHGWGVESIVLESLGNVDGLNTELFERSEVDDELVRTVLDFLMSRLVSKEHDLVMVAESVHHVVGVQDGQGGGVRQVLGSQHLDVGVGDWQDGGRSKWSSRNSVDGLGRHICGGCQWVFWQEILKMLSNTDWSHTRTSSSVRNSESLVQVQVTNVCSQIARRSQTHLCVHVGSVKVHLSAIGVHELDGFSDCWLKHTVGRRIRDHDGCEIGGVFSGFLLKVLQVKVSVTQTLDGNNFETSHSGRSRVGSVSTDRNKNDVSVLLTCALQVRSDHGESSIFTLSTRVWHESGFSETGNVCKVSLKLGNQLQCTIQEESWTRLETRPFAEACTGNEA
ncbi:hypothetical protein OGAPHI_004305 [Ogataea philodendri]|uniref:Uncharacterized protein n=1 Tax=Ogataea philodendri TaxID=1378263 RepID=A0A9P8P6U3_9ASCO|nr:uncharacterized protein OGAPHI_004305 [Ogataea philodendri]KAH3666116.1 hypothetical protein OGAPHI_004305 [Ogataea philodendri]